MCELFGVFIPALPAGSVASLEENYHIALVTDQNRGSDTRSVGISRGYPEFHRCRVDDYLRR